jgi:protein-tyrosine phosphatase
MPEMIVSSAGVSAVLGSGVDTLTAQIASERAVDLQGHISTQLTRSLLYQHDLVAVMEARHHAWIANRFPAVAGRIVMVSGRKELEVADPIGLSSDIYRKSFDLIEQGCKYWTERLAL